MVSWGTCKDSAWRSAAICLWLSLAACVLVLLSPKPAGAVAVDNDAPPLDMFASRNSLDASAMERVHEIAGQIEAKLESLQMHELLPEYDREHATMKDLTALAGLLLYRIEIGQQVDVPWHFMMQRWYGLFKQVRRAVLLESVPEIVERAHHILPAPGAVASVGGIEDLSKLMLRAVQEWYDDSTMVFPESDKNRERALSDAAVGAVLMLQANHLLPKNPPDFATGAHEFLLHAFSDAVARVGFVEHEFVTEYLRKRSMASLDREAFNQRVGYLNRLDQLQVHLAKQYAQILPEYRDGNSSRYNVAFDAVLQMLLEADMPDSRSGFMRTYDYAVAAVKAEANSKLAEVRNVYLEQFRNRGAEILYSYGLVDHVEGEARKRIFRAIDKILCHSGSRVARWKAFADEHRIASAKRSKDQRRPVSYKDAFADSRGSIAAISENSLGIAPDSVTEVEGSGDDNRQARRAERRRRRRLSYPELDQDPADM